MQKAQEAAASNHQLLHAVPPCGSVEEAQAYTDGYFRAFTAGATQFAWRGTPVPVVRNAAFPEARQLVYTALTWSQVQSAAASALVPLQSPQAAAAATAAAAAAKGGTDAPTAHCDPVDALPPRIVAILKQRVEARLQCGIHDVAALPPAGVAESVLNTLRYLYFHQRCGILVAFRDGALHTFLPFANAAVDASTSVASAAAAASATSLLPASTGEPYRNTWGAMLPLDGVPPDTAATDEATACALYLERKAASLLRSPASLDYGGRFLRDRRAWWANSHILCNIPVEGGWGDAYLGALLHMLQAAAAAARKQHRPLPDCTFFLNKRDAGQLRCTLEEPAIFCIPPGGDTRLQRERYSKYAPILGFFVDARLPQSWKPGSSPREAAAADDHAGPFTDIPMPTPEDWEMGCGVTYPPRPSEAALERAALFRTGGPAWHERVPTAVFRGRATGGGTTPDDNQRLALAALATRWAAAGHAYARGNAVDGYAYLDAGITAWDTRDRKVSRNTPVTFLRPRELQRRFGIRLVRRLSLQAQAQFKYAVYVQGHSAAMRYGALMAAGCLILRVAETVETPHMWYFPLLQAYDWRRWSSLDGKHKGSASQVPEASGVGDADHVLVAPDLSDLADAILWAKTHDAHAAKIARNARRKALRLFSVDGQLQALSETLRCIAAVQCGCEPAMDSTPHVAQDPALQQAILTQYSGAMPEYAALSDGAHFAAPVPRLADIEQAPAALTNKRRRVG